MQKTFFIVSLLLAINAFGQINSEKATGLKVINPETFTKNDLIIQVIYANEIENEKKPAYYLNGVLINESILKSINPNEIATVKVEKENIEIGNVKYFGKLIIETKSGYNPKIISLNSLKSKHTNLKENPTIFKIDNEIINADYDKFMVDENYILKIIVEKFKNKNEKLNVNFVNVITRSEENIKKEIIIRGNTNLQ